MLAEPAGEAEFPPSRMKRDVYASELEEGGCDQHRSGESQDRAKLAKDLIRVQVHGVFSLV